MPPIQTKRALITGITGQDGIYLGELLTAKGYEVFGLVRGESNPKLAEVQDALPDATIVFGDLTDLSSLVRALNVSQPSELYNLAGISSVAFSWQNAGLTTDVTAKGALNMLEATRLFCGDNPQAVRFYQASSSEMFGNTKESPQHEGTVFYPRSPYGVAKVFAHYMTINFRESYGMHASSGILFNHESPRRTPDFVSRKISQSVARISLGLQDGITLGNIDVSRDWGYAGDYVEAMWSMMQQDVADDYIIASGETHSLREMLDVAFAHVGIDDWVPLVSQDPRFMRPAEVQVVTGDITKAKTALGWQPKVGFSDLVRLMVDSDLALQGERHQKGTT